MTHSLSPEKEALSFGKQLARLRQSKKWTMATLGQQVGLSKAYVSLLEAGERKPSRDVVIKLFQAFFPEGNERILDELFIAAGFMPIQPQTLSGYSHSLTLHEKACEANEGDFKAYVSLIIALIKSGKYERATQMIQQGFHTFNKPVQLQSLLSTLELTHRNYDGAVIAQQAAIERFNLQDEPSVSLADLLLNLGVIYFEKGTDYLGQLIEHPAIKTKHVALDSFLLARTYFKQALEIDPEHIYLLDEYARVHFNIAYLSEPDQSHSIWHETCLCFENVLNSRKKHDLGQDILIETSTFLAHAYTKSQQLHRANLIINVIMACAPSNWLIHYIEACFYTRQYEIDGSFHCLDLALDSLSQAIKISDQAKKEALRDPDLQTLRKHKRFE